jgi:hypothetical protein
MITTGSQYKLGDLVCHESDLAPFLVTGIRETEIEIQGDFSGGTHNVSQRDWVPLSDVVKIPPKRNRPEERVNWALQVDPEKEYPVTYTYHSQRGRLPGITKLKGADLTEPQIIQLYEMGLIELR